MPVKFETIAALAALAFSLVCVYPACAQTAASPGKFQQETEHMAKGADALAEANRLKTALKSASGVQADNLQEQMSSACYAALAEFSQAIEFSTQKEAVNHSLILGNMGSAYDILGRHEDAAASFRSAIEWSPSAVLYLRLATSQAKKGNFDDAKISCKHASSIDGSRTGECWANIGFVLSNDRRYAEAVEPLRIATKAAPKDATPWWVLANALLNSFPTATADGAKTSSNRSEAVEALQRYLQADPNGPYADRVRAQLRSLSGSLSPSSPLPSPVILPTATLDPEP
jgi:tetratricopeptide (TPR) repeat protein